MLSSKNKITIRQIFIIYIVATLSAAIRLFPRDCAKSGREAAWMAPLISVIILFILCEVLNAIFKNQKINDLGEAFNFSLGRALGKILLVIYLIWCIILFFTYTRYYAERLLSSIFVNGDIRFFILAIMVAVYIALRGRLEAFARFCEIAVILFTFVLIMFFVLLLPSVKAYNVLPITHFDIVPAARATYPILGIWGYITLMFFMGDNIINKEKIMEQGRKSLAFITVMTASIIFFVVGSLSWQVAERMPLPFFNSTKLITILDTLNRMESVLLSIWIISDFIVITLFGYIIMSITKSLFEISDTKQFATPLMLLGYFGGLHLAADRFQLELFSVALALKLNIILCFAVPAMVLLIGRFRKKI